MTLVCFVLLFRYANQYSVVDLNTSESSAKQFAFFVMILLIVPAVLAFIEFVRMLRFIRQICNWNRDYRDEKENEDEVSEKSDSSVDFLKNEPIEDSIVEKSITVSSEEGEYEPKPIDEPDTLNDSNFEYVERFAGEVDNDD